MNGLVHNTVHLVITSPPYWQLKDYDTDNQIGFHDSYENYKNNLNLVWKECYRVLHNGCRLCVNIGDQFARSVYYIRHKIIPIWANKTSTHEHGDPPNFNSTPLFK
jgi:modification methylase